MSRRRGVLPGLVVAAVLACCAARPADARSHSERSQAREARELDRLREEGAAALAGKDFAAAGRAYTELYRRTLQPEGLYRLGLLAHAEGRRLEAQDLMRRFISDSRFDPTESAAQAAEAQRILALPALPSGKLSVIGERGTLVYIDGRLVGALPLARPLLCAPGKRKLTLEDGQRHQEEELDVAVGRSVEITYDRGSAALLSAELSAVLVLEQYPGLAPAPTAALAQVTEDVLQNDRLSPFPLHLALERTDSARPSACLDNADCLLKLARQNELDYVLKLALIPPGAGSPGQLRLLLLDAEVGEEAAHRDAECAAADGDRIAAVLRRELTHLLAAARARPRGELKVTSQPAGAEVRLGRRLLGKTPLAQLTWAGPLEVEVALPGYQSQRLPLTVPAGQEAALAVTLQLDAAEPAPAPLLATAAVERDRYARLPRPRWRLAVGAVALAGGALLGGFGVAALALSGQCVTEALPPAELCRERYGTGGLGAGLLSSGVVALVAGSLLLAIPVPHRRAAGLTAPLRRAP